MNLVLKSRLLHWSGKGHPFPGNQVQVFMLQVKKRTRKTSTLAWFNLCATTYACSVILLYYMATIIVIGNYTIIAIIPVLKGTK